MKRPPKPPKPPKNPAEAAVADATETLRMLSQSYEHVPVTALRQHPENPNVGARDIISESVRVNGFFGALYVQRSTGYVLAGNHRLRELIALGAETVPVIYLDVDDDHARRILLVDNEATRAGHYDDAKLAELLTAVKSSPGGFSGTGFTLAAFKQLTSQMKEPPADPNYERKVESPVYEIHGRKPEVPELLDQTRTRELIAEIDEAEGIPDDVREFLRAAAYRHTVFDYENIAEFYAHAEAPLQRLMERSALVIIDFDQAVELGFVRLAGEFAEQYRAERETDAEAGDKS